MARIRTIKPEICTSEPLSKCSIGANLLFDRMLLFCDDGGVHEYSIYRLKLEVFPGRDDISKENIEEFLKELEQKGLLIFYEVNDKEYLRYKNFQEHQRIDQPTFKFPWEDDKIPVKKSKKNAEQLNNDPRNFKNSSRKRKDQKIFLIQRDGNKCNYCESTTKTLTVDHIIPTDQGGTDHLDNLCLACRQCNSSKYNKLGKPRRVLAESNEREAEENNQGNLDENNTIVKEVSTESGQTDQNLISKANLTSGREGKGRDISNLVDNSSCKINNINNNISSQKNQDNNFQGNDKNKSGRPKARKKWTNSNWEQISGEIQAGFDDFYKNNYPKKKARIEGLCTYANMHGGTGATEEERKQMIRAISAQKLEADLKHETGYKVFWPHISTWIKNRRWEDDVDLTTPQIKNKPKSMATKFMDNVINSVQQTGEI